MASEVATLAGGCFWCTEAVFKDVIGVESVESGYIGGRVPNPTYKQVCGGDTGHAEAIRVTFDSDQVRYGDILDMFFATHDPTTLNRQGNDVGTQYRSAIFPHSDEQAAEARAAMERAAKDWPAPIVTTIEPLAEWYPAEDLARFGGDPPAPPLHFPGEGRGPVEGQSKESAALDCTSPSTGPRPSPGKRVREEGEGQGAAIVTAPGQLASHYAPNKLLRLNATGAEADEYLIGFGAIAGDSTLSARGDLTEAAATLFDALHLADASDRARIAIAAIPEDGIGAAINDRLRRAAHRD
jgi:peptide-methionine (S)-S-oxide reductase